jgi:hypothetical protein
MAIQRHRPGALGIAGNHARWPVYQMRRDTTKEKIPAYFTGFAVEKAPALGFRAFKIPIREGVDPGRKGALGGLRLGAGTNLA